MVGSSGYETEHYDLSLAIFHRRPFAAVTAKGAECEIMAAGVSCRQQIAHGTEGRARHPQCGVLADALPSLIPRQACKCWICGAFLKPSG